MKLIPSIILSILMFIIGYCIHGMIYTSEKNDVNNYVVNKYYDTTTYNISNQKLIKTVDTIIIQLPKEIDTIKVINDYYNHYAYQQSLIDSNIKITIVDTVGENKIINRSINYNLLRPQTIIHNYPLSSKRKIYIGSGVGFNSNDYYSISPSALYIDKKNNAFQFGYDIFNNAFQFGYYKSIGKK